MSAYAACATVRYFAACARHEAEHEAEMLRIESCRDHSLALRNNKAIATK